MLGVIFCPFCLYGRKFQQHKVRFRMFKYIRQYPSVTNHLEQWQNFLQNFIKL